MELAKHFRSTALVVENDPTQRENTCALLEESDFDVIQCESGEAAELVIEKNGSCIALLAADIELSGYMGGMELAEIARERAPDIEVIITSDRLLVRQLPN